MSGLTLEKHVSDGCDFHSTYSVCALHLQARPTALRFASLRELRVVRCVTCRSLKIR